MLNPSAQHRLPDGAVLTHVRLSEREKTLENEIKECESLIVEASGAAGDEVRRVLNDLDDTRTSLEQFRLERHLATIGEFLCEHGDRHTWRLLFVKYGADCTRNPFVWSLAESYQEHAELQWLYGPLWEKELARLDAISERS